MSPRPRWPGWREAWRRLVGSDHSPGNLALAVGLGALVAPTPVLGLHTWMAIGLAFVFRVNRLAAFLGSNIANPLTMAPIVWLDVTIGSAGLGRDGPPWQPRELDWELVRRVWTDAWVGAAVLGPALMAVSYVLTRWLVARARSRSR